VAAAVWGVVQVMGRTRARRILAAALGEQVGAVAWEKVVELLVVNRLIAPRSELSIHEKWFPQTAMSMLLDTDGRVGLRLLSEILSFATPLFQILLPMRHKTT
jgi:hypothetical protein